MKINPYLEPEKLNLKTLVFESDSKNERYLLVFWRTDDEKVYYHLAIVQYEDVPFRYLKCSSFDSLIKRAKVDEVDYYGAVKATLDYITNMELLGFEGETRRELLNRLAAWWGRGAETEPTSLLPAAIKLEGFLISLSGSVRNFDIPDDIWIPFTQAIDVALEKQANKKKFNYADNTQ